MNDPKAKMTRFAMLLLFAFTTAHFSMAFANEFRYDSKGYRDPFLSPSEASVMKKQLGPGELFLQGIIYDEKGSSYAMVNGEIVKEGDIFAGVLLKKIEPNAAIFERDNETFVLHLREDEEASSEPQNDSTAVTETNVSTTEKKDG